MNNPIFQYSSATVGALAVLAVIYVFIRTFSFKIPGFGLLVAGVLLIGLPVWQSGKLSYKKGEGFDFEFVTKQLQALNAKLADVQAASVRTGTELKAIASNVDKVRATTTVDLASRVAATSPEHKSAVDDKLKPLSGTSLDPATAEILAKDPQLQNWIQNAELLSKKVEEQTLALTHPPPPNG